MLLRIVLVLALFAVSFVGNIAVVWSQHGFHNIDFLRPSLTFLYFMVVFGSLGFGVLMAQVQKRL